MNTNETSPLPLIDISGETGRHTVIAAGTENAYQGHPTTVLTHTGKLLCVWTLGHGGRHCRRQRDAPH